MKEIHTSLLEELNHNANEATFVNEKKLNAFQDSMPNVCDLGGLQESDTRRKESTELVECEEGEISDSDSMNENSNKVCKFFKQGNCLYGSNCQFLHISHKVYKMFDPISSYKKGLKVLEPCYFVPEIGNPLNLVQGNNYAWENGLDIAKAMIQKAIFKRIGDKEFETKKMYISSDSSNLNISLARGPVSMSVGKSKLNANRNIEPPHENSLRNDKGIKERASLYKSDDHNAVKSNHEHKWVDPWRRSRSPRKRKKYEPHSRKEYNYKLSSPSSSSSLENKYRVSVNNKFYKRKSPAKRLKTRCCSRSYSRSISRSASRSCSSQRSCSCSCSRSSSNSSSSKPNHSSSSKPKKISTSYKVSSVLRRTPKKRRSTSLEKWFKGQHKITSRSSSRPNILLTHKCDESISSRNSGNESLDSISVSSITCSRSSSLSVSPKSQNSDSKLTRKNELSKTPRTTTEPNNCHCFHMNKLHINHAGKSESKESAPYKSSSRKVSKTPTASSCTVNKDIVSQHKALLKPDPKLSPKPPSGKENAKDHFSSTVNTLLKYQTLNKNNKDTFSQHKPLLKPDPKLSLKPPSGKENAKDHVSSTVNTLLKYRTLNNYFNSNQDTISKPRNPNVTSISTSRNSKTLHTPDQKRASGCVPKRVITLNLQPESRKILKLSKVAHKNQDPPVTMSQFGEMASNKRNILLKQLKLVEDAIAKKKSY